MRKAISIGLLLILTVTLVPRQVWHHCDHGFELKASIESFTTADDCGICDYVFSLAPDVNQENKCQLRAEIVLHSQATTQGSSAELASLPDGRAPPVEIYS